jgi:PAS domain S-box-containing protein
MAADTDGARFDQGGAELEGPQPGLAGEPYRNIWELTSDLAFSARVLEDGSLEVDWVTEAFARDFDLDGAEQTGIGTLSLVHQLDKAKAEHGMQRLRSGRELFTELRLVARDGTLRWTRFYARPVLDPVNRGLLRVHGAIQDVTDRKQAEHRLRRSVESLRRTEEERRRVLSALDEAHKKEDSGAPGDPAEEPIDAMTAAARRLEVLTRDFADAQQAALLDRVDELMGQAVELLRDLVVQLRPPELDNEGLAAAVWAFMEQARGEAGIEYRLENKLPGEPNQATRLLAYRILQEALGNVRRHSRAEHVEVLLEARDDGVFVRVWDDGLGFAKHEVDPPRPGQFGISSMRERAEMAGGWCRVDSLPALGTRVEFWVPSVEAGSAGAPTLQGGRNTPLGELLPEPWGG